MPHDGLLAIANINQLICHARESFDEFMYVVHAENGALSQFVICKALKNDPCM